MKARILLADDSASVHRMAARVLENAESELISVANGDFAAAKLNEFRPDIVIADAFMPGKDGYELCQTIKESPTFKGVPVLLLYGGFEPFDRSRAQKVGADAFLEKPFQPQALLALVKKLLAGEPVAPPVQPPKPPVRNQYPSTGTLTDPMGQPPQPSRPQQPTGSFEPGSLGRMTGGLSAQHQPTNQILGEPVSTLSGLAQAAVPTQSISRQDGPGCRNHPEEQDSARCSGCAETFCPACLVELLGQKYCRDCKVLALQGAPLIPELTHTCKEANHALAFAIAGLFCFGFFFGPFALKTARDARGILDANPMLTGHGRVIAAQSVGVLALVLWLIWLVMRLRTFGAN